MNFMNAIEAHVRWKIRLEAYIEGTSQEKLDHNVVCQDDQCLLGKWIYGRGGELYSQHPKFPGLKEIHRQFHRCAGEVIRLSDVGEKEKARELLCKGEYAKYSHQIKAELARMSLEIDPD